MTVSFFPEEAVPMFTCTIMSEVECTLVLYSKNPGAITKCTGRKRNAARREVIATNFYVTASSFASFHAAMCTLQVTVYLRDESNDVQFICEYKTCTECRLHFATLSVH